MQYGRVVRALDLKSGGSRFSPVFVLGYHGFNSCAALCMQPPGLPPAGWDFKTQSSIRFVRIGPDFMLIYEFFLYKHHGYQSKNLSVGYLIHEFSFVQCHIRRFSSSSLLATPLAPYRTTFLVVASMTAQSGFFFFFNRN